MLATLLSAAAFAALYFFLSSLRKKPTKKQWPDWPVIGMLPSLALNMRRLHAVSVQYLQANNGAVMLRLANVEILVTAHPDDVRHIMQTNSEVYNKGDEWRKRFDVFGKGYFNSDTEDLRLQKVGLRNFLGHQQFHQLMAEAFRRSVDELKMVLSHASERGTSIKLNDFLHKQMFRASFEALWGCELPDVSLADVFSKAISDSFEAIMLRYALPCWFWRAQNWIGMGRESKAREARETLNDLAAEFVSEKKRQLRNGSSKDADFSFLKLCLTRHKVLESFPEDESVLRENFFALLFAAEDTTSTTLTWFFLLVGKRPEVEEKIVEELRRWWPKHEPVLGFCTEELKKMVFLHAALCETLRMFPPIAFEARTPLRSDILPSGHHVSQRTKVVLAIFVMGRMKQVWGEDCEEFKPERWITAEGRIKYEPPHKFFAFSAGQRMCPGKDIAFGLMKAAVGNILYNYHVRMEQDHPISFKTSILLQMEKGLMAKIEKRS